MLNKISYRAYNSYSYTLIKNDILIHVANSLRIIKKKGL
jgi:hypothetical protein